MSTDTSMNVLLLAGRVGPGGVSPLVLRTAEAMRQRGVEVRILCKGFTNELIETSVPVMTWRDVRSAHPFAFVGRLAERVIETTEADIVHVLGLDLGSTGRRFLRTCPVPYVLSVMPPVRRGRTPAKLQRRAAHVLASSDELREDLVNTLHLRKKQVTVLSPGLNVSEYPSRTPRHGQRVPVVGVAGVFSRSAGFEVFLDAAAYVLRHTEQVRFVLAGDGREERRLRAKVDTLDIREYICFTQRLADYRTPIETMDIFVEPSLGETFPDTMLEAMAFGKAVIATPVGGVYPFIDDGHNALVVPKGNAEALGKAILSLIRGPEEARRLGQRARNVLRERFNLADSVDRILSLYARTLEAESAGRTIA